ncbi:hypothetical protein HHK36_003988 [Tetracentron sinense]|uniref:Epidermal patterning factor-like protein n=1 Tax=Tetracentron sinense TaxID=13715 RepID=A0A835DSP9_TETSI|nr:hypothetical protein HHK36_003988 [Tetracentron sinense]
MTMNLLNIHLLYTTTIVITVLHLLSPASCVDQKQLSVAPQGLLMEDKTRLGSAPPSCHNKCNQCHPCMAVQVPTLPIRDRVEPGLGRTIPLDLESSPSTTGEYSNYKPLGWKCRCGDRLFNP